MWTTRWGATLTRSKHQNAPPVPGGIDDASNSDLATTARAPSGGPGCREERFFGSRNISRFPIGVSPSYARTVPKRRDEVLIKRALVLLCTPLLVLLAFALPASYVCVNRGGANPSAAEVT